MDDQAWELLLEDIKEIRKDARETKNMIIALRVKVATIGGIFGFIGAFIYKKLGL